MPSSSARCGLRGDHPPGHHTRRAAITNTWRQPRVKNIVPVVASPRQPDPASWAALPQSVLERLRLEGISSPADWLALPSTRRAAIFGVPPGLRRTLTELARRGEP